MICFSEVLAQASLQNPYLIEDPSKLLEKANKTRASSKTPLLKLNFSNTKKKKRPWGMEKRGRGRGGGNLGANRILWGMGTLSRESLMARTLLRESQCCHPTQINQQTFISGLDSQGFTNPRCGTPLAPLWCPGFHSTNPRVSIILIGPRSSQNQLGQTQVVHT